MKKNIKEKENVNKKQKDIKNESKISIKDKVKRVKEHPKQTTLDMLSFIKKALLNNKLFVIFVIINVVNGMLLRMFTIGGNSLFALDALLSDLAFVLLVGAIGYLFNEKGRFIYLLIVTIVLSALCVLNSAYYTFYTSFSSISLLSTARFITDQGDAVVENVLQPKDLIYAIMPILFIFIRMRYKKNKDYINSTFYKKNKKSLKNTLIAAAICEVVFC